MCGRFYVEADDPPEALARWLREADDGSAPLRGELRPGDSAAVIADAGQGPRGSAMRWGYPLPQRLVFNARSESARQKSLFAEDFAARRCLVPATAYFEWDHRGPSPVKYRFRTPAHDLLYLAGLWHPAPGRARFTILTRAAAGEAAIIHDRMPVILREDDLERWLRASPEEAGRLMASPVTQLERLPADGLEQLSFL